MKQAIGAARPGGYVSYVGVPHRVQLDAQKLFFAHVHLHGGPGPARRYLPRLIELIESRKIDPGKVFDLTLSLEKVAEGYRATAPGQRRSQPFGTFTARTYGEDWPARALLRSYML